MSKDIIGADDDKDVVPMPVEDTTTPTPKHSPFITSLSYKLNKPFKEPKTKNEQDKNYAVIPPHYGKTIVNQFRDFPDLKPDEYPDWFNLVKQAAEHEERGGVLKQAIEREGAHWDNRIVHAGENFTIQPAKFTAVNNQVLTGKHALSMLMSNAGISNYVRVPCWHSGFWLTVTAPADEDIIALDIAISDAKIHFGRATGGLVYSNSMVYTIKHLMDFIIKCSAEATVVLESGSMRELRTLLAAQDIPAALLGIMTAMYPEGYQYQQPCVQNPTKCQYVLKELLDLSLLLFEDTKRLSTEQVAFMCGGNFKRPGSKTVESVKLYQEGFSSEFSKLPLPNSDITVHLSLPTVERYETNGMHWVDTVVDDALQTLTPDASEDVKNTEIIRFANASVMRNYGHYVTKITIGTNEINDSKTISDALARFSSKKEYRKAFSDGIKQFISDTTIALVAVESFECPSCGTHNQEDNVLDKALIPLDVISLFFDTCERRLLDLANR